MPRTNTKTAKSPRTNPFQLRDSKEIAGKAVSLIHVFKAGETGKTRVICDTDSRGYATPGGRSPQKIVIEASEGFIPLWTKNMTLRWRFQERSMRFFANPAAAKSEIRKLLGEAILAWGDAAPVKFNENDDTWDFEIVMRNADDCEGSGCVLASGFFPDAGRHVLELYPKMFTQIRKEQVDTLIHEIGHVFGLRHFFSKLKETRWASETFEVQEPFSIMNYGNLSELTADDKSDLKRLYRMAWSGELTKVNETPIRFVQPFHTIGEAFEKQGYRKSDSDLTTSAIGGRTHRRGMIDRQICARLKAFHYSR